MGNLILTEKSYKIWEKIDTLAKAVKDNSIDLYTYLLQLNDLYKFYNSNNKDVINSIMEKYGQTKLINAIFKVINSSFKRTDVMNLEVLFNLEMTEKGGEVLVYLNTDLYKSGSIELLKRSIKMDTLIKLSYIDKLLPLVLLAYILEIKDK